MTKKLSRTSHFSFYILFLFVAFFLVISITPSLGQVNPETDSFRLEFESFSKTIQDEFESFSSKNDSIFILFLEESWKLFEMEVEERHPKPKPDKQPVVSEKEHRTPIDTSLQAIKKTTKPPQVIKNSEPEIKNSKDLYKVDKMIKKEVDFYGSKVEVYFNREELPTLIFPDERYIVDFYKKVAANQDLLEMVILLNDAAKEMNLNDWGFIRLLGNTGAAMYSNDNDQCLFIWFALLKSGINARIGYNQEHIYLLVPSKEAIYNSPYFTADNAKYYLISLEGGKQNVGNLYTYQNDYPGEIRPISLRLVSLPELGQQTFMQAYSISDSSQIITIDKSLVNFYHGYPDCELEVFFEAPLSDVALKSLDSVFLPQFNDKSEMEILQFLLEFVQMSIHYQVDEKQFGRENYLFAEETLFYSKADCEDRSVLLAKLIDRYTNFKTIGLDYPEHVSLAVKLNKSIKGDYVEYNNSKYYICDPTYLGAKCGMIMPSVIGETPKIIVY